MEPEHESLTFVVVATGVLVLNAPTPLQVIWLLALTAAVVALGRLRGRVVGDPGPLNVG